MIGIGAPDVLGMWEGLNKTIFTEADSTEARYERHGPRKITTDITIRIYRWGQPHLSLESIGYNTEAKMRQMAKNYLNNEGIDQFRALLEKHAGKTMTLAIHMKGPVDKFTSSPDTKGGCLQYMNFVFLKGNLKKLHIHYRTTEITKKFYADLVFIDHILKNIVGNDRSFLETWMHIPMAYGHVNQFPIIDILVPTWKEWAWEDQKMGQDIKNFLEDLRTRREAAIPKWGMIKRTSSWWLSKHSGKT